MSSLINQVDNREILQTVHSAPILFKQEVLRQGALERDDEFSHPALFHSANNPNNLYYADILSTICILGLDKSLAHDRAGVVGACFVDGTVHVKKDRQRRVYLELWDASYIERPVIPNVRFDMNVVANGNSRLDFRFSVVGIKKLGFLLGLPAVFITTRRYRVLREKAMCVLVGRMAFPTRLDTMHFTSGD
ncbi:unnamed protein product [Aphanomyces euteiches]